MTIRATVCAALLRLIPSAAGAVTVEMLGSTRHGWIDGRGFGRFVNTP